MTLVQREAMVSEVKEQEREIRTLTCELWWLDAVAACYVRTPPAHERLARQIEFATAQLTRRRIRVALLSSRLERE